MAWIRLTNDSGTLPGFKFNLSIAAVNQMKVDQAGNLNILVRRLPEPDKHTKATHTLYFTQEGGQVFDESSELLIAISRKKIKDCFLLNGFCHFDALPVTPKSVYKKLNAYTYNVKEDMSFNTEASKETKQPNLGYAYLKVQADHDKNQDAVGRLYKLSEGDTDFFHLYINKIKVLERTSPEAECFYLMGIQLDDTENEYRLMYSTILNYKETDFVFVINRKAFMKLGMSDNNGHVIFVSYFHAHDNYHAGDLEMFYVHYNPSNQIREKSLFEAGNGWSKTNMHWLGNNMN